MTHESNFQRSSTPSPCPRWRHSIFRWHMAHELLSRYFSLPAGVRSCGMQTFPFSSRCKLIIIFSIKRVQVFVLSLSELKRARARERTSLNFWSEKLSHFLSLTVTKLFNSNGRPGEASVVDDFRIDWGTYMSSHNDIIYIKLDVRGSRGQGKKKIFRHLGRVEVEDQIAVVEWVNLWMRKKSQTNQ